MSVSRSIASESLSNVETAFDRDLRVLQMYGSGLISRRSAIEALGFVKDVNEEMERIEREHSARALLGQ